METISVNGIAISEAAIASEMQHHPARTPGEARANAAHALAIRTLLLSRARSLGLNPEPLTDEAGRRELDEDALIRQLLDLEVKTPAPDDASCRRYYENNRQRFTSPDIYEASHILFSADRGDAAAYDAALARAKGVLTALQREPHRFEEMARSCSDCPSAAQGGNLGQLTRGQTTPEFETFLLALEEGQLCAVPVKTRYGVHILKLHRRLPGKTLPFELAERRIADFLREAVWRKAVAQYLSLLAAEAEIQGIELRTAQSPLVQ